MGQHSGGARGGWEARVENRHVGVDYTSYWGDRICTECSFRYLDKQVDT